MGWRISIALVLAVLPWWTVSNRAAGLMGTMEWRVSFALRSAMRNLGNEQVIYRSDSGHFGTREELERAGVSAGVELPTVAPGVRTSTTLFGETVAPDSYTISGTSDELPWVRGTVTVTADERIEFASSVDWLEDASRFDLFEVIVSLLGVVLAVIAFVLTGRSMRWRNAFGLLAVVVVGAWLWSFSYRPLIPAFTVHTGPTLGDSTWTFM